VRSQHENRLDRIILSAAARCENPPFMLAAAKFFARIHRSLTSLPFVSFY
jgi:hypothetical protein